MFKYQLHIGRLKNDDHAMYPRNSIAECVEVLATELRRRPDLEYAAIHQVWDEPGGTSYREVMVYDPTEGVYA